MTGPTPPCPLCGAPRVDAPAPAPGPVARERWATAGYLASRGEYARARQVLRGGA